MENDKTDSTPKDEKEKVHVKLGDVLDRFAMRIHNLEVEMAKLRKQVNRPRIMVP